VLMLTRCGRCGDGGGASIPQDYVAFWDFSPGNVFSDDSCTTQSDDADATKCAHDSSSNAIHMTQSVTASSPGWYANGNYLRGDGADDHLIIDVPSILENLTGEHTISCWFLRQTNDQAGIIFAVGHSSPAASGYGLGYNGGQYGRVFGWSVEAQAGDVTETWTHVTITKSGTSGNWDYEVFINGVYQDVYNETTDLSFSGGKVAFFRWLNWADGGWHAKGQVQAIFVYDRVLPQEEVDQLYAYKRPGSSDLPDTTKLLGDWNADHLVYQDTARTTIAGDGDPVGGWDDWSATGHVFGASGVARPTLRTNVVNGHSVIEFDGTDDYLNTVFTCNQPAHVFAVLRIDTWNQNDRLWDGNGQNYATCYMSYSGRDQLTVYANGASTSPQINGVTTTGFFFVDVVLNGNSNSKIQVNDITRVTGTNTGTQAPGGFTLGSFGVGASQFGAISIARWVAFAEEKTTTRQDIKDHLVATYNVTL